MLALLIEVKIFVGKVNFNFLDHHLDKNESLGKY